MLACRLVFVPATEPRHFTLTERLRPAHPFTSSALTAQPLIQHSNPLNALYSKDTFVST